MLISKLFRRACRSPSEKAVRVGKVRFGCSNSMHTTRTIVSIRRRSFVVIVGGQYVEQDSTLGGKWRVALQARDCWKRRRLRDLRTNPCVDTAKILQRSVWRLFEGRDATRHSKNQQLKDLLRLCADLKVVRSD